MNRCCRTSPVPAVPNPRSNEISFNDNQVGIRAPIGLSYMFDREPIDIFVEIRPAIDIAPSVRGDITGGIGIRYWF